MFKRCILNWKDFKIAWEHLGFHPEELAQVDGGREVWVHVLRRGSFIWQDFKTVVWFPKLWDRTDMLHTHTPTSLINAPSSDGKSLKPSKDKRSWWRGTRFNGGKKRKGVKGVETSRRRDKDTKTSYLVLLVSFHCETSLHTLLWLASVSINVCTVVMWADS